MVVSSFLFGVIYSIAQLFSKRNKKRLTARSGVLLLFNSIQEVHFHVAQAELGAFVVGVKVEVDDAVGGLGEAAGVLGLGVPVDEAAVGGADEEAGVQGDDVLVDGDIPLLRHLARAGVVPRPVVCGGDAGDLLGIVDEKR